jgi:hypothetical protein
MACAAGFVLALATALSQAGEVAPFSCTLPEGYQPFTAVAGDPDAWEAASADQVARFFVEHRLLESLGAKAELVARDQRVNFWQARFGRLEGFSAEEWKGVWGGLPEAAGFTVRYPREKQAMAAVERIGIVHDHFIHFVWEGPAAGLPAALACAESFRVPDAWIPAPPPSVDVYRGMAPGTEARSYPWRLDVQLDLVPWAQSGVIEVRVRATPAHAGGALPSAEAWRLPNGALSLTTAPGEMKYRLDPLGEPANLANWGIGVSPMSDLAACDAIWLAIPDPGPGRFLPPAWTLEATHPGHMVLVGPNGAKPVFDEVKQYSATSFAAVPAGRSWPFFLAGRFEERLHAGIVWKLRKDAKTLTPDQPVAAIARLHAALRAWMPSVPARLSIVSFPGIGDRVLPGLIVLDENREWFSQPMDATLSGLTRRTWLARLVGASCFGVELRGSGNGAPVLENALAEYAAFRLLEAADWKKDAAALRGFWTKSEAAAGPLPMPLTLLPLEDVLGSQRILTAGALFWTQLEADTERKGLDEILRKALAANRAWSTQDLTSAAPQPVSRIESLLYSIPKQ